MFKIDINKLHITGWYLLNLIRIVNITALSGLAIVDGFMISALAHYRNINVFDIVNHAFTLAIVIVLFITELPGRRLSWLDNQWPAFSDQNTSSLVWLSLAMFMLGFAIIANLDKPALSIENFGQQERQSTMAVGILSLTAGGLNLVAAAIYWDWAYNKKSSPDKQPIPARELRWLQLRPWANKTTKETPSPGESNGGVDLEGRGNKVRHSTFNRIRSMLPHQRDVQKSTISGPISYPEDDVERGGSSLMEEKQWLQTPPNIYDHPHKKYDSQSRYSTTSQISRFTSDEYSKVQHGGRGFV